MFGRSLKASIAPLLAVSLLAGCGGGEEKSGTSSSVAISYKDVTSEYPDLRYEKTADFVFRSKAKLDKLVKARGSVVRGKAKLPNIDFNKRMLVVVAAGVRSSAGYRLKPVSVRADGDTTVVRVRELTPPPDSMAASVLTYPYLALSISKRPGPVKVKGLSR